MQTHNIISVCFVHKKRIGQYAGCQYCTAEGHLDSAFAMLRGEGTPLTLEQLRKSFSESLVNADPDLGFRREPG